MFFRRLILSSSLFLFILLNLEGYSQQTIEDFYLSNYKEDGSRDWEIEGEVATIYDQHVDIDKMKAKYYAKDDTISVSSKRAKLEKGVFNVFLRDDVHIENKGGITLTTDSLDWIRNENRITTSDLVKIQRDQMQIKAKGLDADTEFKKADFKEDVEVKYPEEKSGDFVTATCSGPLEIEYNNETAVFHDDVVVTHKEGKMFADKATIFFDREAKELTKIISQGNVKIIRQDNVIYADKATYFAKEGRLVLEGTPHIVYFPESSDETP